MAKKPQFETLKLDVIVGGGQALGTLEDGRKAFVWGGVDCLTNASLFA